jgi:hypothetical protein
MLCASARGPDKPPRGESNNKPRVHTNSAPPPHLPHPTGVADQVQHPHTGEAGAHRVLYLPGNLKLNWNLALYKGPWVVMREPQEF